MKNANVSETVDLKYKSGYVKCLNCNWRKELGDGFNGYLIDSCPNCTPELETHYQRKVMYNDKVHRPLTVEIGTNIYFVLSNGIHVRYEAHIYQTYHGLTEAEADKL